MSFSSAPLQIGRLSEIQKARLQRVQAGGGARLDRTFSFGDVSGSASEAGIASAEAERMSTVCGFSAGVRAMMVEFVKQVHLQNVGGAVIVRYRCYKGIEYRRTGSRS